MPDTFLRRCAGQQFRQLALQLRPRYLVLPVERFVMEVPHVTIEIRDTAERQLVTAIEILLCATI